MTTEQSERDVPDGYKLIRDEIRFEHSQINSRMSWFLASQTIFAAAYAAVASQESLNGLLKPIACLGLLLSALIFASLLAAICKLAWLRSRESGQADQSYYVGSDFAWKRFGRQTTHCLGLAFPFGAPLAFIFFWIWLALPTATRSTSTRNEANVNITLPASINVNVQSSQTALPSVTNDSPIKAVKPSGGSGGF